MSTIGQTSQNVVIPIVGDTVFEPDETINLQLINLGGGNISGNQSTTTYTILNDAASLPPVVNTDTGTATEAGGVNGSSATGNVLTNNAHDAPVVTLVKTTQSMLTYQHTSYGH